MVSQWARGSDDSGTFRLEVFGETAPVPVPLGRLFSPEAEPAAECPAYLYVWTFGYTGDMQVDTRVTLLFPSVAGWRCKDVQAVVYHLPPVQKEQEWRTALAEDVQALRPMLDVAARP
ncbi:hypothetical protein ACWGI9_12610 [Streptomyces sp. NPDC054833]